MASPGTFRRVSQYLETSAFNPVFLGWARELLHPVVAAQVCVNGLNVLRLWLVLKA
jgi:hypothetical protein